MKSIIIVFSAVMVISGCAESKKEPYRYNFGSQDNSVTDSEVIAKNDALPIAIDNNDRDPLSENNPSSYKYLTKNMDESSGYGNKGNEVKAIPDGDFCLISDKEFKKSSNNFRSCMDYHLVRLTDKVSQPSDIAAASFDSCDAQLSKLSMMIDVMSKCEMVKSNGRTVGYWGNQFPYNRGRAEFTLKERFYPKVINRILTIRQKLLTKPQVTEKESREDKNQKKGAILI
ncbi:TPA: hypothetical protein I9786_002835 [Serratia marcescens]|nr:hypothetical protein [Serratia marcescens]HAT5031498.1 hypothetical protein [Serratia marcescens]